MSDGGALIGQNHIRIERAFRIKSVRYVPRSVPKHHEYSCTMRFIHLLLAFAVGISAAHLKRDAPPPAAYIGLIAIQTHVVETKL